MKSEHYAKNTLYRKENRKHPEPFKKFSPSKRRLKRYKMKPKRSLPLLATLVVLISFFIINTAFAAATEVENSTNSPENFKIQGSEDSENTSKFAYITDQKTPYLLLNNSTYRINVSTYRFPLKERKIDAEIFLIDVCGSENLTYLESEVNSGNLSGKRIALTNESSELSNVSESIQEKVLLYWTRTAKNLENLLVYAAKELDGRNDLISAVQKPERTSILLVVLPNSNTIESIREELSDYGIDCQFANLSAMGKVARDPSQAKFVNEKISTWDGDIIFEYVADAQYELYKEEIEAAGNKNVKLLGVGGFSSQNWYSQNVEAGKNITTKLFSKSSENPGYWRTVLPENLVRMFIYIAHEADSREDLTPYVKPTMIVPPSAIYHPDAPACSYNGDSFDHLFLSREEYNKWYKASGHHSPSDKWIGITMYYRDYQEGKLHTENAMIQQLEADGYNVVASYVPWNDPINRFYNNSNENMSVDSIISFNFFGATDKPKVLNQSDVPVLKAVSLSYQTYEEWEKNPYGMNGAAITWKLEQPEIDGVICPIPVEAQFTKEDFFRYPIPDRVNRLLGQAKAYADLRHTQEEEKKIAIIYFNHPPGKQDVGASYLNLFDSLELMLASLNNAGYKVQSMTSEELQEVILKEGRNIGGWAPGELNALVEAGLEADSIVLLDVDVYKSWFNELPKNIRGEVIESWGAPPGDLMVINREEKDWIVIPVIKNGNIILTPEPARGWEEDTSRLYHDLNIAPPHQYMAFYLWLQHPPDEGGFGADAIVHVGRHGTQEWLPGKMLCLNATSYPDLLLGDMPNIYPYIVDGAGEGIQAKRRGYATLISHLTPPIAQSGVYGDLTELKNLFTAYQDYKLANYNTGMANTKNAVIELLNNSTVDEDLGLSINEENFEEVLEELIEYLEEISAETIPYGTHTFGEGPEGEKAAMFLETMHHDLLLNTSCNLLGYDKATLLEGGIENLKNRSKAENLSKCLAFSIENSSSENSSFKGCNLFIKTAETQLNRSLNQKDLHILNKTYETANRTLSLLNASGEIAALVHALDGGYILPSEQGDPINNPNVLPTGRNYYGFEAKKIPNPESWEVGKAMADELLMQHYSEYGKFPEKVAVSLWSVETLRHKGVMEAMVLRLMGAEPEFYESQGAFSKVHNDKIGVTSLENLTLTLPDGAVIPRPRVDVVITTSGLYRDTLQYQLRLLDTMTHTISGLEESPEKNYIRKNSQDIKEALLSLTPEEQQEILETYRAANPDFSGDFKELAEYLASLRVFAPPPGGYGVGIEKEIGGGNTKWNSENATDVIGDLYMFRMANLYTTDSEGAVQYLGNYESIFRENLNGTEVVFNSRSSSLYGVLDNDDFFQYVGGLSAAVQAVSGETPDIKVVNLRGKPKLEGLDIFLSRELKSRVENSLYLKGMMSSEYSGMKEIAEIVENLYGWQVTNPDLVSDYMWNDLYETLVLDKHNLGIKEAFDTSNPYAHQALTARMLECIRKGYWDASEEVIANLVREYAKNVEEYGVTCCHHTCGNPGFDGYVRGMMSVPGVVSRDTEIKYGQLMDKATGMNSETDPDTYSKSKSQNSRSTGSAKVLPSEEVQNPASSTSNRSSFSEGGYGTDTKKDPQPEIRPETSPKTNYVEGYELSKEKKDETKDESGSVSFSSSDIMGLAFIMLLVGAIFMGYKRKKI